MTNPLTAIHDALTGLTEVREMTDEEFLTYQAVTMGDETDAPSTDPISDPA